MKNESLAKKLLNHFEVYAGAGIFIIMTILLFVQVVTRYCLSCGNLGEEVAINPVCVDGIFRCCGSGFKQKTLKN